jgi:hypothetical protein
MMERKPDGRQVWYEWALKSKESSNGHDAQQSQTQTVVSERHSSREVAYPIMESWPRDSGTLT